MLLDLLLIIVMGTAASRLLGIRLSWPRRLAAAFLGVSAGTSIAFLLSGWRPPQNPASVDVPSPAIWAWSLLATMAAVGLFELASRPGQFTGVVAWVLRLPRAMGAARARLRRSRRLAQILGIAARSGLGAQLAGRGDGPLNEQGLPAARPRGVGKALRPTLEDAGGAFVKLGQFLSTRPDLVPEEITAELAGLQDDVSPEPQERIDAVLGEDLGSSRHEIFQEFDPEPVAAASIAQVHRARLATGESVAVKVQRPGVRALVERDLDILRSITAAAEERAPWAKDMGAVELADGFSAALLEELDFGIEARNIASVSRSLEANDSIIRIPRVYESLSTSRVLVLEWMEGVPLRAADTLIAESDLDRTALARALLRGMLRQIILHGVFHADPHPGNVLVRANGTLALIDFGSVGRLDSLQQSALARLLLSVAQKDPRHMRDALLDIAEVPSSTDEDRLERALGQFVVQRLGDEAKPDAALFRDLFNLLLTFGLSFPPAIAGVFRALVTIDGTLRLLDPRLNLIDEAKAEASEWIGDLMVPGDLSEALAAEALSLVPVLRRLPRRVDRIAGAMERGELAVNVRLFADDRDARFINRAVNRTLLTVIAATLGFVSTQLLNIAGGPTLTPSLSLMQALGYLGLGISVVLFLRAFVAIMQTDR
jgi:ubiquinone biosynthesis protein